MPDLFLFPGVTMYIFYEGGGQNSYFRKYPKKNGGFKSLFPLEPSLYVSVNFLTLLINFPVRGGWEEGKPHPL